MVLQMLLQMFLRVFLRYIFWYTVLSSSLEKVNLYFPLIYMHYDVREYHSTKETLCFYFSEITLSKIWLFYSKLNDKKYTIYW